MQTDGDNILTFDGESFGCVLAAWTAAGWRWRPDVLIDLAGRKFKYIGVVGRNRTPRFGGKKVQIESALLDLAGRKFK